MPPFLFGIGGRLIGYAAIIVVVGGVILFQHLRINSQARTIAELRVQTLTLKVANDHQAETIDKLTRDKSEFEKRAAVAEAARKKAETSAAARIKAALKRLNDAATEQDRQPVSPALRDALEAAR